jgi:hypothetical protein
MTATSTSLEVLADKLELTELVVKLARAVDRKDRQGILDCYSEKSFDDHGRFRGGRDEFAEFIANNPGFTTASAFLFHQMGQSLFEVDGDEAWGETYYTYTMQVEPEAIFISLGRYLDFFERKDGVWRITYRRVVVEWDGSVPAKNAVPGGHFRGTRDETDPLYARLRWPEHPEHLRSNGS